GIRGRTVTGVQTCALPISVVPPLALLIGRLWDEVWSGPEEKRPRRWVAAASILFLLGSLLEWVSCGIRAAGPTVDAAGFRFAFRSEERRVGKECRARWCRW